MSYSRWLNSAWYTFWSAPNRHTMNVKEKQVFEICSVKSFTYEELNDIYKCIDELKELNKNNTYYSDDDYKELIGYMLEFRKDVDNDFKEDILGEQI